MNIVTVNGKVFFVDDSHTLNEWEDLSGELWDFLPSDILTGAVEPHEFMVYWCIDGRLYETNERIGIIKN